MSKRAGIAVGGLLLAASVNAAAQSLAEVAAREKARRAGLESGVPTTVIDGDALERERGVSPPAGASQSAPEGASAGIEAEREPTPLEPSRRLSAKEVRDLRETWARVWTEQMASAEDELAIARDHVKQCRTAELYVFVPLAIDCYGTAERLALARFRVEHLRMNRFNWELLLEQDTRAPPIP